MAAGRHCPNQQHRARRAQDPKLPIERQATIPALHKADMPVRGCGQLTRILPGHRRMPREVSQPKPPGLGPGSLLFPKLSEVRLRPVSDAG